MAPDSIEKFAAEVRRFVPDWGFIELKAVAYKGEIGWILDSARAILLPQSGRWDGPALPSLNDVFAIEECWSIDRLEGLLKMVRTGELEVGNQIVHAKQYAGSNVWNPPSSSLRTYGRHEANIEYGVDSAVIALTGYASDASEDARQFREVIDAELKGADPPWEGVGDLRTNFIGLRPDWATNWSSRYLEIIAPLGAHIAEVSVQPSHVRIDVELPPRAEPTKLIVSLFVDSAKGRKRHRQVSSKSEVSVEAPAVHNFKFKLPEQFSRISCSITYRGREVDHFEKFGLPAGRMYPHLLASREIIGNLDSLLEALGQGRGREFELPVALLFHMLGFYTGHYGFRDWPAGKPAPDIVAFPDSGNWFLVVEATGREPDLGNKMGKLATRTKELQRAVEGRLAYPVIITALDRKLVNQSDLGKAESELISVVTTDELSLMVQMVAEGMTPAKVRDFLERLIPRVEGTWTKSWPRPQGD